MDTLSRGVAEKRTSVVSVSPVRSALALINWNITSLLPALFYVQLEYVEQQEPKSAEEFHIKSQARTRVSSLSSHGCRSLSSSCLVVLSCRPKFM